MRLMRRGVFAAFWALAAAAAFSWAAAAQVEVRFSANPRNTVSGEDINVLLVEEFNARNSDIQVVYEPVSGDWTPGMLVQMVAGTAPDVIAGWDSWFRGWLEDGLALPLDPYLRDVDLSDFIPSHLALFRVDGRQMALPHYTGISGLFYNPDLFDEAGVAYPDETWTWGTLRDAALRLTRRTATGVEVWGMDVQTAWDRLILWIWEAGGRIVEEGAVVGEQVFLDEPAAVDAVQFLQDLIHSHEVAPAWPAVGMGPWDSFWNGRVAMWQTGSWDVNSSLQNSQVAWDVAVRPQGPGGRAAVHTSDGYMVYSGSRHPDEAARFLLYLTSHEAQSLMVRLAGLQPARLSLGREYVLNSPGSAAGVNLQAFIDQTAYVRAQPMFRNQSAVNAAIWPLIDQIVYENAMPASVGMAEMARLIRAALAEQ